MLSKNRKYIVVKRLVLLMTLIERNTLYTTIVGSKPLQRLGQVAEAFGSLIRVEKCLYQDAMKSYLQCFPKNKSCHCNNTFTRAAKNLPN